ncbi:Ubiquitin carboxyl-terminal hydrolase 2 [Labeo rohita]|uniref:Ubiquitin carboxyl-terminal hydrolase 2 n=1 Tax=Labeo rohita TaxID=84645 RepID=A0ABQ8LT22_LABRO|nr:Ubiquitin carboxyl-terminal hydrolase 2 [Labeo rohita]
MLEEAGTEEELEDEGFKESGLDPTVGLLDPFSGSSPATTSSAIGHACTSSAAVSPSPVTPTALQQLVANEHTTTASSGPTAVPTSLASAPPYVSIISASLASTPTTSPSGPPAMTPTAPKQQLAVDERCIPKMDRVDSLAEYLASTIIVLWQNLLPYDHQRVAYSALHQLHLTIGRFRCSKKKPEFTAGVGSMTRCILGLTGSPAQFDVNQITLIQWHNKQLKRQECNILLQGINLPASIPVAPVPLPPVQVRPTAAPPQPGPQHQYHLPRSTAGQAVVKRKSEAPAQQTHSLQSVCQSLPAQRQLFPQQASPLTYAPLPAVSSLSPASDPLVQCIQTDCSCWPPFLLITCLEALQSES